MKEGISSNSKIGMRGEWGEEAWLAALPRLASRVLPSPHRHNMEDSPVRISHITLP